MVLPTASSASDFSKERLQDMILSTPQLRRLVSDKRLPAKDERSESTLALKMFPGGFLALGGSNSPNTFARWSVRIAVADDCDRFPPTLGDEGDPGRLLLNRTTSYPDPLAIFISTPVHADGRISQLYAQSDRRKYFVRCPACGFESWITWSDSTRFFVKFDHRQSATARIACPCGAEIREPARMALVRAGQWRPTSPAARPRPSRVSPAGDAQSVRHARGARREVPVLYDRWGLQAPRVLRHLPRRGVAAPEREGIDPLDLQARAEETSNPKGETPDAPIR